MIEMDTLTYQMQNNLQEFIFASLKLSVFGAHKFSLDQGEFREKGIFQKCTQNSFFRVIWVCRIRDRYDFPRHLVVWELLTNVWEILTNVWEIPTNVWEILTNVWEIPTNAWEILTNVWVILTNVWVILTNVWEIITYVWEIPTWCQENRY